MPYATAMLFDLDGTLVDSRADLTASINHMRRKYGYAELDVPTVTSFVGNGMRRLVERAIKDTDIPLQDAIRCSRSYYFKHLLDATTLYQGVRDTLETLHELGIRLALVTNKPVAPAEAILDGLNIRKWFGAVVGGDSCAELKPHPDPLRMATTRFDLELPQNGPDIWMVGDNYTDLQAAHRAGCRACLCRYGFGSPRDLPFDKAVERPADLVRIAE